MEVFTVHLFSVAYSYLGDFQITFDFQIFPPQACDFQQVDLLSIDQLILNVESMGSSKWKQNRVLVVDQGYCS